MTSIKGLDCSGNLGAALGWVVQRDRISCPIFRLSYQRSSAFVSGFTEFVPAEPLSKRTSNRLGERTAEQREKHGASGKHHEGARIHVHKPVERHGLMP